MLEVYSKRVLHLENLAEPGGTEVFGRLLLVAIVVVVAVVSQQARPCSAGVFEDHRLRCPVGQFLSLLRGVALEERDLELESALLASLRCASLLLGGG